MKFDITYREIPVKFSYTSDGKITEWKTVLPSHKQAANPNNTVFPSPRNIIIANFKKNNNPHEEILAECLTFLFHHLQIHNMCS